jgi:hypothetical protein
MAGTPPTWMAILNQYRAQSIADGKIVGEQLCRLHGTTHSRAITAEMDRRGLLHKDIPGFWIGAVLRDPRFVNTGRIVMPPLAAGAASHDPRLIWLWRLAQGGVARLILYEYTEYCGQNPAPTIKQKVDFILRHVVFKQTEEAITRWHAATRWVNDEYTDAVRRDAYRYADWVRLFESLKKMRAGSQAKARAEAKRLVRIFVEAREPGDGIRLEL